MSYDSTNTNCGRCGAPTRTQVVKGLNVQACVSCGAYTLDQLTLERLLGGPNSHWGATPEGVGYVPQGGGPPVYPGAPTIPAPPPAPPALPDELPPELPSQKVPTYRPTPLPPLRASMSNPPPAAQENVPQPYPKADSVPPGAQYELDRAARESRNTMLLAVGVLGLLGVGTVIASLLVFQGVTSLKPGAAPAETVTPTELDEVLASEKSPAPQPAVTAEPAEAEPEPEPEPEPAPKARPRPADPVAALVAQGWNQVGARDISGAANTFKKAIDLSPGHADANYGYGYALLQQGNPSGAKPYLCKALDTSNVEVQREVSSMLRNNQLSCN